MTMESELKGKTPERVIGRYAIYDEIASGGMAVVHLGRMLGQAGFSRTVAIKRLHPQFAKDPSFVAMFLDEARLAVRVQHPNVVAPLDVLVVDGEVLVVMEYVAGDTLARLQRSPASKDHPLTPAIAVAVMSNALYGLHAAHEAVSEDGRPLHIVHRDVSPQNIMVGANGLARVLDFGVARAAIRSQSTSNGEVRGKLAYMAPEQLEGGVLDQRTDVFAAGIVAWELLSQHRLFNSDKPGESMSRIVQGRIPSIRKYSSTVSPELDQAVLKALDKDPAQRQKTARDFAIALERACSPASPSVVGDWVKAVGGDALAARAECVAAIETQSSSSMIRPLKPPPRTSGMVPVRVSSLPIDSESKVGRPLSRVTIPLVNDGPPLLPSAEGSPAHTLVAGGLPNAHPRRALTLKRRTLVVLGVSLVFAGGLMTVLVRNWLSVPIGNAAPSLSTSSVLPSIVTRPEPEIPAQSVQQALPNGLALPAVAAVQAASPSAAASAPTLDQKPLVRKQRSASGTSTSSMRSTQTDTGKSKSKSNCSPPYFVDSKGIRRLRPECI